MFGPRVEATLLCGRQETLPGAHKAIWASIWRIFSGASCFDNYKPLRVKVDRYQTVRVDRNRYSVPRAYVGRWVWAHVSCWQVEVFAEGRKMAEHERVFANCKWQIDPLHYLDLISQRPGAFESARPILQWRERWPEDYEVLLARLRIRLGENSGTRGNGTRKFLRAKPTRPSTPPFSRPNPGVQKRAS